MGVNIKIENLSLNANQSNINNSLYRHRRLVSKRQMVDLSKVNCFRNKNLVVPIFKL